MKVYLATLYSTALTTIHRDSCHKNHRVFDGLDYSDILESYHYIKTGNTVTALRNNEEKIFLDSGAFSMFTQGASVDLEAYANFIKQNPDIIEVASNLDHIGQNSEQKSYDNQKTLESYGVNILPVHHARDGDKWLLKYLEEGYDHICLGGMVPETTVYLRQWLDRIWSDYLTDTQGRPLVKVHGFGLTTEELMFRYPWYSVDSTRWVMASANGTILIDLPHRFLCFAVSNNSPMRKKRGQHLDTVSSRERDEIINKIEAEGFNLEDIQNDYAWRWRWNIEYYNRIKKNSIDRLKIVKQPGLFA